MTTFIDKYAGQGGNYVRDPKTGERTLVHRTEAQEIAQRPVMEPHAIPAPQGEETNTADE